MKRDLTEGGIRVPRSRGGPAPSRLAVRMMPTGTRRFMATWPISPDQPPADIDSDSFARSLKGTPRTNQWKREHEMYWEFYERGSAQAVRFGKWKAIRKPMFTGPIELYDMSNDAAKKGLRQAPPDLARHAANSWKKCTRPIRTGKARAEVTYFKLRQSKASSITSRCSEAFALSWRSGRVPFQKGRSLGQRRCEGYADGNFKIGLLDVAYEPFQKHVLAR